MKKFMTKIAYILLAITLAVCTLTVMAINPVKTHAAEKAHCAGLKLGNDIRLNKTKTFKKTCFVQECDLFPKKKNVRVNYTIKCNRKSSGKNYKVTYKVNYKLLDNPKIVRNIVSDEYAFDDEFYQPRAMYTVFNYQTGKTLGIKNKSGVKVKGSNWKEIFYPKQYCYAAGDICGQWWYRNYKSISNSFTVIYPKKCKDVVVGIGLTNLSNKQEGSEYDEPLSNNQKYWKGKVPYGKTDYYKKGKKIMSYMRLSK